MEMSGLKPCEKKVLSSAIHLSLVSLPAVILKIGLKYFLFCKRFL